MEQKWAAQMNDHHLLFAEAKIRNMIRQLPRAATCFRKSGCVPANAWFVFNLAPRRHGDEGLLPIVCPGIQKLGARLSRRV